MELSGLNVTESDILVMYIEFKLWHICARMVMPIQKESVVTSEEKAKGIRIEVIYFIIL
jgi:hypothetical protein